MRDIRWGWVVLGAGNAAFLVELFLVFMLAGWWVARGALAARRAGAAVPRAA
jgi:hypothetical protein